ncbi:MAG: hypothetical protein H7061_10205 [Bdellovibrionaceae bacterium]|nr:hypothetical protein [Bdellovibrio sp.]
MKKLAILLGIFGLVVSCTSAPNRDGVPPEARLPHRHGHVEPAPKAEPLPEEPVIDYVGLQRFLKLDRNYSSLGYSEHLFNTCEVGFGYSRTNNCDLKYFVVSHFRLQCRDSEGTISKILTEADLRPISREEIFWTLRDVNGTLYTDSEGYGQIRMVSSDSQRDSRLKLTLKNDYLYLKAGELKQMTTPKNWCNN